MMFWWMSLKLSIMIMSNSHRNQLEATHLTKKMQRKTDIQEPFTEGSNSQRKVNAAHQNLMTTAVSAD